MEFTVGRACLANTVSKSEMTTWPAYFDIRSERGLAGGVEIKDRKFTDNPQVGRLNLYYANDTNSQLPFIGPQELSGRSNRYQLICSTESTFLELKTKPSTSTLTSTS